MSEKFYNIFFKILFFAGVTGVLAVTTLNLYEVPTRYGITSEDPKMCEHLGVKSITSCRSQNFAEVRNTISYLRADVVPAEESCLMNKQNLPEGYKNEECPEGYSSCYSRTIPADFSSDSSKSQEQYSKVSYYLFEKDCRRLLYFSSSGLELKQLLRIKETGWILEQDLLQ